MDLKRLYEILNETTIQIRKGEVIHGDKPLVDAIRAGVESDSGFIIMTGYKRAA